MIAGQIERWVDNRYHLLEEGDSIMFPGSLPHRYRNPIAPYCNKVHRDLGHYAADLLKRQKT